MFSPLIFYTAPSTPIVESPASQAPPQFQGQDPNSPPLTPVTHIAIPHVLPPSSQSPFSLHTPPNGYPPTISYPSPSSMPSPENVVHYPASPQTTDDSFPETPESLDDTTLDDEGLSTLERIYLYSRSKSSFHRVFIASALPELLKQVTPHEAIEYVLPLLNTLAMDDDEMVKEAFSSKLVTIIWWFFTRCQLTPGDIVDEDSLNPPEFHDHEGIPTISVQAFTPILGTLLLSPNVLVGGATRYAVVALLGRIKRVNAMESKLGSDSPKIHVQIPRLNEVANSQNLSVGSLAEIDDEEEIDIGFFGKEERSLFQKEILFQVVVGMGRLDSDEPDGEFTGERDQHGIGSSPASSSPSVSPSLTGTDTTPFARPSSPFPSDVDMFSSGSSADPFNSSGTLTIPSAASSPPIATTDFTPQNRLSPPSTDLSMSSPSIMSDVPSYDELDEEGEYDQATIGRLSSMSLVAAVAASGYLDDQLTDIFVSEVARVSRDPVYWVRREACFALGALAKIVPAEVVQLTLLRTLQTLVVDPVHHVRHSSLFALPTILGRLPLNQRRQMALEIIIPMSMDESADVRAGVLEALGEVIYTFHEEDNQTPPEELLKMFLGRTQDRRIIDGQQPLAFEEEEQVKPVRRIIDKQEASEAFYTDPTRPLICAFNFPAVALTVGRTRWASTLRDTYLWLAESSIPGVRRTLAASLGEMAKIIGEDYAQQDLLPVWVNAFRGPEDDVRLKLIDCLAPFIVALPRNGQLEVFNALLNAWSSGAFTSWREREGIAKSLIDLLSIGGLKVTQVVANLLMYALADTVNTVREAAINNLPGLWMTFKGRDFLDGLRSDFLAMARSEISRRRMTYIACQQALLLPKSEGGDPPMKIDDELCRTLSSLASDHIVGVRIGVARVIGLINDQLRKNSKSVPASLLDVIHVLSQDSSNEVRSYVADCLVETPPKGSLHSGSYQEITKPRSVSAAATALTFSRPPPARKMVSWAS
ncbi:armadillo-type protein [Lentinula aff. lateritia]|uniref:Armadillo-type protein n=1 Tax=Lentinula aff. lateritia TaxID=2804960 RepID=A0ACC1U1B8_9AGAR|nr:armadillo-type protein [Lentinula aff. lateritia]